MRIQFSESARFCLNAVASSIASAAIAYTAVQNPEQSLQALSTLTNPWVISLTLAAAYAGGEKLFKSGNKENLGMAAALVTPMAYASIGLGYSTSLSSAAFGATATILYAAWHNLTLSSDTKSVVKGGLSLAASTLAQVAVATGVMHSGDQAVNDVPNNAMAFGVAAATTSAGLLALEMACVR